MTPEQEAVYALDYGSDRGSLSPAGQEAYDRILERRRSGKPPEAMSLVQSQAGFRQVVHDAKQALTDGRRVFLCRVPMFYERPVDEELAGLPGPSSVVESIEDLGWRLDQMSWLSRGGVRVEGILLFRRDAAPQPGTS
jgi:hypothetical protein